MAYVTAGGQTAYSPVKTVKLAELESGVSMVTDLGSSVTLPEILSVGLCVITFDANGGEGVMESQGLVENRAAALRANAFTREGYAFRGWSTTPTGNAAYTDTQSVTFSENTTLYAVWDPAVS